MNRHTSKFKEQHEEQTALHQNSQQSANVQEFATAELLLRHESTHIQVPPIVAERLRESVAREPAPARSWWQRWRGQPS